jgi:hypothetical protein
MEGTFVYPDGTDLPSVTKVAVRNAFCGVPEAAMRRMVGENAIDVFGLDRATLQRIANEIDALTVAEIAAPIDQTPPVASTQAFRNGPGPWW